MAIKKCKECGKDVSTKAKACPHCGCKDPTGPTAGEAIVGFVSLIVIILLSVYYCSGESEKKVESEEEKKVRIERQVEQEKLDRLKVRLIAKYKKEVKVPLGEKFFDSVFFDFDVVRNNFKHAPSPEQLDALVKLIRLYGYRCDVVDKVNKGVWSVSFSVYCNGFRYHYSVEDKGGNWVVVVK